MLLEHVNHYNNLHFSMEFTNVSEEAPHYHKEMEMVLMLRGYARYKVHHQDFLIKSGDLFVVDTQDLHYIYESSDDVIMLQFHADVSHFKDEYPNIDVMFFVCEEAADESPEWQQRLRNKISFLSNHIADMMLLCEKGGENEALKEKFKEFVYIIADKFQAFFIENNEFHQNHDDTSPIDLERLYRIMNYMYLNYSEKITLDDVADLEHLSIHYISHFIKKTSGLSFQNLLNYIRVEQAEKLLNEQRYNLTQISELCGFSTPAYFNKCFSQWHGITPAQYRKTPKPATRSYHKPFSRSEALILLQDYLNTDLPSGEELQGGFLANHIAIPVVKDKYSIGSIRELFRLKVIINHEEALKNTVYYIEELNALNPYEIIISKAAVESNGESAKIISLLRSKGLYVNVTSENLPLTAPLSNSDTVAEAFSKIVKEPELSVFMFDDINGLFMNNGLPSPVFSLYSVINGISGEIIELEDSYIMVRNYDGVEMILHNYEGNTDFIAHIQFDSHFCPRQLIKQTFEKTINPYDAVDSLGHPSNINENIRDSLFSYLVDGNNEIIPAASINNFRLNIAIKPGSLVYLKMY